MMAQAPLQTPPQAPATPTPTPSVPIYAEPVRTAAPTPTPMPTPTPTPYPQYNPPAGYTTPAPNPWQPAYAPRSEVASAAQRLSLAIVSLALMIPLVAIVVNFPVSLGTLISAGLAIATGLIGITLIALAVICVNLLFNWDMLRGQR